MKDSYSNVMQALSDADKAWTEETKELEITKQALASAVADVDRLQLQLDHSMEAHRVMAAVLVEQALPTTNPNGGSWWIIKLNDQGMECLMERAGK